MVKKVWVDPPEGWRYGFPKIYNADTDGDSRDWMIREGYPEEKIIQMGEYFYCGMWSADEEESA